MRRDLSRLACVNETWQATSLRPIPMGDRREQRIKAVLPVKLWGTDANGQQYMSVGHTLDVSRTGARLGGVTVELKPDDTVGLQYKTGKARYRVMWVGKPTGRERQIGVVSLQPEKDLWGNLQLPATV